MNADRTISKIRLWPILLALLMLLAITAFADGLALPGDLTVIESGAFLNDTGLTGELRLPVNVVFIGSRAFEGCTGLTGELIIPPSVKRIESRAFMNCTGLTGRVVIPASVTYLAPDAFIGTSLTIVYADEIITDTDLSPIITMTDLPAGMTYEMTGEGAVITGWEGLPDAALTLPAAINGVPVVAIGDRAFEDCYGLRGNLVIPSTVKRIGDSAFFGCSGLTGKLVIPSSVTEIGDFAFFECLGLTGSLTLPESVVSVGESAFAWCEGMTGTLSLPANVTLGDRCFQGAGFTGSITVPATITLGAQVFLGTAMNVTYEAPGFTYVSGGAGLTVTGWNGPVNAGLTLPLAIAGTPVTAVAMDAFAHMGLQGSVVIPSSVTSIGEYAFAGNPGITSLRIGSGVTEIGDSAFSGCTGLDGTTVTLPAACHVSDTAFEGVNVTIVRGGAG